LFGLPEKSKMGFGGLKKLIALSVITLSGYHCTLFPSELGFKKILMHLKD
jgi:hypothetical protein